MTAPRSWRDFPRRHPAWTTFIGVLVALALGLAVFDWNWFRGPLGHLVSAATGREFRIDGTLDVDYFPLQVHATHLYFANARWSDEPAMARVDRLDMRVRFWPLLLGHVVLPEISLDAPWLRLERNAAGAGNWQFGQPQSCSPGSCRSPLRILHLRVRKGLLDFREPTLMTALQLHIDSAAPLRPGALAPLVLHGAGNYRAAQFELDGRVDSPLALENNARHYSLDLTARAGDTHVHVFGTLTDPLQTQDLAVNLELGGADLAQLYDFAGIVLPPTPPYALQGRLTRTGARLGYRGFSGRVGNSDISGDAQLDIGGARPKLTARLHSKRVDIADLSGFIGGTPGARAGQDGSAGQRQQKAALRARGKVLPDRPIRLDALRRMDADVQFSAADIRSAHLPLENMQAHLMLDHGRLSVDPLDVGAAGGKLATTLLFDGSRDPARFSLNMKVQHLQLPRLLPRAKALRDSVGTLGGSVELRGGGNSTAAVLGSASGSISLIMGQGRISNLVLELAGLDVAESLKFLLTGDKEVRMRCAYADFGLVDGVATARAVALDTTDTALVVRGSFDMGRESLDLTLLPRPKDESPLAIRAPIRIDGTFAHPSVHPSGKLVLRGAAVAALAAIAPPLAMLGLVETGPGHDLDCGPSEPPQPARKPTRPPPGPRPPPLQPTSAHR